MRVDACDALLSAAPAENELGKTLGYPVGAKGDLRCYFEESLLVGSNSNMDQIFETRRVSASVSPRILKQGNLDPDFRYRIPSVTPQGIVFGEQAYSIDEYLQRQRVSGLLILKDDEIVLERYQYDRCPDQRFISFSMAKSITSLAIGCALDEGRIDSLDDKIGKYVKEMAGHMYGETSIRNVLRMSSGIRFSENMDGDDDFLRFLLAAEDVGLLATIQSFKHREAPEGSRFQYATIDTYVLGLLLSRVLDTTLSDYVSEKIWKPMGAESDAKWIVDRDGLEFSGSGFNAALRDYGRLGMLLANNGMRDGVQFLPKSYLREATDWKKHPSIFHPMKATPVFGYGYQFWIFPGESRRFAMVGIRGQVIYVDTQLKLVLVQTAVAKEADFYQRDSMGMELGGVWRCLLDSYAKS